VHHSTPISSNPTPREHALESFQSRTAHAGRTQGFTYTNNSEEGLVTMASGPVSRHISVRSDVQAQRIKKEVDVSWSEEVKR